MSVHYDPGRKRWVVRWREDRRQRTRRFTTPAEAESFDEAMRAEIGDETAASQSASLLLPASEGGDGI
jgi:hypothetical protein